MDRQSNPVFKYGFSNKKINQPSGNSSALHKRKNGNSSDCATKKVKIAMSNEKASTFTMESIPEHHFHLGGLKFAVVSNFSNVIRIHLRQFKQDDNGFVLPTKSGVTLTPFLWKSLELDSINLHARTDDVIVIRDAVMISTTTVQNEPSVTFQRYFKRNDNSRCFYPSVLTLSEREFNHLESQEENITNSVITAMFGAVFHQLILQETLKHNSMNNCENATDAEVALTTSMLEMLKDYLSKSIEDVMDCHGCRMDLGNQLGHECMTSTHEYKLRRYGNLALCNIDLKTFASEYVQMNELLVNFITLSFLQKLDFKNLLQNAKDLYVASDPDPNRIY